MGSTMISNVSQIEWSDLTSFEGRIAIYLEGMRVFRVRIVEINVNHTQLFAKCKTVETHGLDSADKSWDISAHAIVLTATSTYWSARYVGWNIFFNPTVIQRVLEIVSVLPPGKSYLDDYSTSRPVPSNSEPLSICTPGTCAIELFTLLRAQQIAEL